MTKKLFVITRFSVVTSSKSGSRAALNAESLQDYRDKLMSISALKERLMLFKQLTLHSLKNQKEVDAEICLLILTSDQLPGEIRDSLVSALNEFSFEKKWSYEICNIASGFNNVDCDLSVDLNINDAITRVVKARVKHGCFATVRLDDDDVLSSNFMPLICEKINSAFAGYIITFPYGFQAVYDKSLKGYKDFRYLNYPKIALGLAHINFISDDNEFYDKRNHVYALGNHTSLDVENVLIIDSREKVYIRTITGINDSGDVPFHKYLPPILFDDPDIVNFPGFILGEKRNNESFECLSLSDKHKLMIRSSKDYAVNRMNRVNKL